MEDKGMKLTIVGAVLIVAGIVGVLLLIQYLNGKLEQSRLQQGQRPPQ